MSVLIAKEQQYDRESRVRASLATSLDPKFSHCKWGVRPPDLRGPSHIDVESVNQIGICLDTPSTDMQTFMQRFAEPVCPALSQAVKVKQEEHRARSLASGSFKSN